MKFCLIFTWTISLRDNSLPSSLNSIFCLNKLALPRLEPVMSGWRARHYDHYTITRLNAPQDRRWLDQCRRRGSQRRPRVDGHWAGARRLLSTRPRRWRRWPRRDVRLDRSENSSDAGLPTDDRHSGWRSWRRLMTPLHLHSPDGTTDSTQREQLVVPTVMLIVFHDREIPFKSRLARYYMVAPTSVDYCINQHYL